MRYARLLLQFCLKLGLPNWVDYLADWAGSHVMCWAATLDLTVAVWIRSNLL
jgi:hypothetical protein